MPLKPFPHDRDYGEMEQVLHAYLGQTADDTPEERSTALEAYLRHTWHTRPWVISIGARQVAEFAKFPPSDVRIRLGEYFHLPDTGLPQEKIQSWLECVAGHLRASVDSAEAPEYLTPQTHWEWHARFPELGQLLGGWFSQGMPEEFGDHAGAVADYRASTAPGLVARLIGELHELLGLNLDEADYAVATVELGMEVEPPDSLSHGAWFAALPGLLAEPAAAE
ncbi:MULTISPECIES: contact-dependent growth inhibition system immunity protein [Streptomyces]|uniref:contact-dependent growth inhibition system immunity protein n=1 Tax=Streptomyces TaxID=1883 RepID=UPI00224EDBD1|nr:MULTISPECIES: contact-dependent growth inhibition system immunity protein [Streptomyces]MCX5447510.1 contact-dependent growth inhibition system immunity protein [Streptomyces libani]MCX5447713.1 contact-dependent growth inhibition system immunity protein [Streptomyces libani]WDT58827.1 contact-dependent growth inhibition system immunity protein [Streptomyces sp. G7(2002)]